LGRYEKGRKRSKRRFEISTGWKILQTKNSGTLMSFRGNWTYPKKEGSDCSWALENIPSVKSARVSGKKGLGWGGRVKEGGKKRQTSFYSVPAASTRLGRPRNFGIHALNFPVKKRNRKYSRSVEGNVHTSEEEKKVQ